MQIWSCHTINLASALVEVAPDEERFVLSKPAVLFSYGLKRSFIYLLVQFHEICPMPLCFRNRKFRTSAELLEPYTQKSYQHHFML